MFDIIGDVHGCHDELVSLLKKLGYISMPTGMVHSNRTAVFVGDLCDRGPASDKVLSLVMKMVKNSHAVMVMGNHDHKLMRYLRGNKVNIAHGLQSTIDQIEAMYGSEEFKLTLHEFLATQPIKLTLDSGKLHIVHAAAPEKYQEELTGKKKKAQKAFALYGVTTGKTDKDGFPERVDWAQEYSGKAIVVHGHVVQKEVSITNNVFNVDTGCVFGNKLTALRYPELELVSVKALQTYRHDSKLSPQP